MAYEFRGNIAVATDRTDTTARPDTGQRRSVAQVLAFVFGLTFLLVGVGGFIPGVTTPFDELGLIGTESEAELLGVFRVSVFHNIVHILFGVGIIAAARESWSLTYLIGGGIAYVALSVYGVVIDKESDANFPPLNSADDVLHTGLAIGLLAAGLVALAARRRRHGSRR